MGNLHAGSKLVHFNIHIPGMLEQAEPRLERTGEPRELSEFRDGGHITSRTTARAPAGESPPPARALSQGARGNLSGFGHGAHITPRTRPRAPAGESPPPARALSQGAPRHRANLAAH